ncbi:hypothetical protein A9G29_11015 [Gilliamella sp. Fer2-1]|jgi:hypothetical protein|nr:hypothetical protein A9G29_11015 [Gilliamella apicola]
MNHNLTWLNKIAKEIEEQGGGDLYYLIETMYKEHKMNLLQFIYDASRGIGCDVHEGLGYALDEDYEDPQDFKSVDFYVGEMDRSELSPQKFVELMQIISNSYIEAHSKDKDSIEFYMNKLRERYSK